MDNYNRYNWWLLYVLLLASNSGYGSVSIVNNDRGSGLTMTQLSEDLATVRQGRILFSHHSVGANIISGMKRLDTDIGGAGHLRLANLEAAISSKGPMLIDFTGGKNQEPKTKIDAFAATIRDNSNLKPDLAFMKFCYVDFNPQTDVDELFRYYSRTILTLKHEHPEIQFAHVTVPLTTTPTDLKHRIFRFIGKEVWEDMANVKRTEFSRRIKETFGSDPVFELAQVEATAPDGSLSTFSQNGQSYISLYSGYAEDDGHLNIVGQKIAGEAAIRFMAKALKGSGSAH